MSDVRVGLQVTGETAGYQRAVEQAERALRDSVNKQNIELQRLRNAFMSSMKAASEFRDVGIRPLTERLDKLSREGLPRARVELERYSESTRKSMRATADQALGLGGAQKQLEQFSRSTREARNATLEQIAAIDENARKLVEFDRKVMGAIERQKGLSAVSDEVTRRLAEEALAAGHAARELTEKERSSLKAAVAQKVLSEESEKTARKLLLEAEAADIDAHALARRESKLLSNARGNDSLGSSFLGLRRTLIAVAAIAATVGIGPVAASVGDLGVAAVAAGANLVSLSGALTGVASAMGGFIQVMGVFKASGISDVFKTLGESGDKLRQDMNGLSEPARAFAVQLRSVVGTMDDLKGRVGGALFPGLTKGLKEAAPVIEIIKGALVATAHAMGQVGEDAGRLFGGKEFQANLRSFGSINAQGVKAMGDSLLNLFDGFLRVERIATPLIRFMQRGMVDASKAIDDYTKNHARGLSMFFAQTKRTLSETFGILTGIGGILKGVFTAAMPAADAMARAVEHTVQGWSKIIQSPGGQNAIAKFFHDAQAPLGSFMRAVGALAGALANLATQPESQKGVTAIFNDLRTLAIPALKQLADLLVKLTPNITDLLHTVLQIVKDMVPGLKPLLPFAQMLLDAVNGLLTALDKVMKAIPGGATAVDVGVLGLLARGKLSSLAEKLGGGGKLGGIMGIRGPGGGGSTNPVGVAILEGGGGIGGVGGGVGSAGGGARSRLGRLASGVAGAIPIVGTVLIAQASIDQLVDPKHHSRDFNRTFQPTALHPFGDRPGASARETARDFQVFTGQASRALASGNVGTIARTLKSIREASKDYPKAKQEFGSLIKFMQDRIDALNKKPWDVADHLFKTLQTKGKLSGPEWAKFMRPIDDSLKALPTKARVQAENAIIGMAEAMERKHHLPAGSAKRIHDSLVGTFHDMGLKTIKSAGNMVVGVGEELHGLLVAVSTGIGGLGGLLNDALLALGVKHGKMPPPKKIGGDIGKAAGAAAHLAGALFGGGAAQGGWVGGGQRGAQGPDNTLIAAYEGEAFLNHKHQPYANLGLAVTKAMGMQPYGSLGEMFAATGGAMAAGGYVSGKVSTFGPPGEASGPTAYGRSSADPGIALNPTGTSSGWDSALARSWGEKWFRVQVGEGAANLQVIDKGPNANGRKIDVTGSGSEKLGIPQGSFPTDSIGHAMQVSGPGDTKGGAHIAGTLPRMLLGGTPGVLRNVGQGTLDRTQKAMQDFLNKQAPDAASGSDFGKADVSMYAFPLMNFAMEERVDRGQDMGASKPFSPTVALGAGHVDTAVTGFPGVQLTLSDGPAKGQQVFYGHTSKDFVSAGQTVRAGQQVGATGGPPEAGIDNSGHTEIGFMPGYYSQTGSWQGPGSRGGMMMHSLLHHGWPGKIGERARMAGGGFAHAAKSYKPPKHHDRQHHGKKARVVGFAEKMLRNLGSPNITSLISRVNTGENRISGREDAFTAMQTGFDRTQEQSMVTVTDADLAYFQSNPDLFKAITGFNIGDFQADDQVPNVQGGVFGRYFGAAPGDPTRKPRGGTFTYGIAHRQGELNSLMGNRNTQLAAIKAMRHLRSVIITRVQRAIAKRGKRMQQIRHRAQKNIRRIAAILRELRSIQGAKLNETLKNALSSKGIARRRAANKSRLGELRQEIADEQHFLHDQPPDERDSTDLWRLQNEERALSTTDSLDASLERADSRIKVANLGKLSLHLRDQLGHLEHSNRELVGSGGDNLLLGTGGTWGKLNTQVSNLQATSRDQLSGRHQDDLAAGDVRQAISDFKAEMASYIGLSPIMPRDVNNAAAGGTDSQMADLINQELQNALKDLAVSQAQGSVFGNFAQLVGERLVGSFARGGVIPETGLALVHAGEHVSPAPEGPYGSQIVASRQAQAPAPIVHLTFRDKSGELVDLIDARVDGRAADVVSRQLGARARQIRSVT